MATIAADTTNAPSRPWIEALSRDERRSLMTVSSWRGGLTILMNWGIVAATFAMVAYYPNILTALLAILIFGGRQLGCAIVMHESAHRTLFANTWLNDTLGNWFGAYPIWLETNAYRKYHLVHHAKNWTDEDPDRALAMPFPTSKESLRRKFWRDLSGQTGWKRAKVTLRRDLGRSKGKVQRSDAGFGALRGVLITNGVMLAALAAFGQAHLYLLWVIAWFTTFSLIMRIRAIAEHSMISDPADPLQNTRTTIASWWERLIFAPNRVNYHLEHHLFAGMPLYNLPKLHSMLKERGVYDDACIEYGYAAVLKKAGSKNDKADYAGSTDKSMMWGS